MLMFGKMSVGVRAIVSGPIPRISRASTTNVYGRFRATRTIHMRDLQFWHIVQTGRAGGVVCSCNRDGRRSVRPTPP